MTQFLFASAAVEVCPSLISIFIITTLPLLIEHVFYLHSEVLGRVLADESVREPLDGTKQ